MLGIDGQTQERWRHQSAREGAVERRQRILQQDLESNSVSVCDDNGADVSNLLAQLGKPLTADQVIAKLKKCNRKLYFERSKSDHELYGIYLVNPDGRVHVTPQGEVLTLTHICGMQAGVMPEFSVLHKTKKKVPNPDIFGQTNLTREIPWKEVDTFYAETRGWRTVLVRLLHAGLITKLDVEKHFGWTPSRESEKWFKSTQ